MARTRAGSAEAAGDPAAVARDPTRGTTRDRRWQDFRRAVREARAAGAHAIRMHGAKVWLQQPQPQPQQPHQQPQSKSTVEDAATQQDARQEAQPSARKRRSAKRMHEFMQRKRLEQLANCKLRLTLLKALRRLRWERVQAVWTSWMRANARAVLAVPMLLEPSEQAAPPSTPHKIKKRTVEERSPDKAGPASGAAHASSPTTADGTQTASSRACSRTRRRRAPTATTSRGR